YGMLHRRRLVWKIAFHGIERDENLADIHAVVAGVLIFRLHDADDRVRYAIQLDGLPQGFALGEELLFRIAAQERHMPALFIVLVIVESSLRHGDAADYRKLRK